MISMKILDVKTFMSSLLIHSIFDNFLLCELDITTFNHFHLSGKLNMEWYNNEEREELEEYSYWKEIKPFAYQFMKGNKTPQSFKIVLLLSPENTLKMLEKVSLPIPSEDINGLFLNIRYEHNELHLITGTSLKTFTLDKTLEHEWDAYMKRFFKHYEIVIEEE